MKSQLPLLLLLLLAAVSLSSGFEHAFFSGSEGESVRVEKGCCLPKQWEGHVGALLVKKRLLRPIIRMANSKVGIDYANQKMAARSAMYCPYTKKTYVARSVVDFAGKKAYAIFKNKCRVFDVQAQLPDNCVPGVFSRLPSYYYGSGGSQMNIAAYGMRSARLEYFLALTSANCVPVKGAFRRRFHRRTKVIGKYQYYNVTAGNADKDLYTIPANCTSGDQYLARRSFLRRLTDFEIHPLPQETVSLFTVSREPLSVAHDMMVGHAGMYWNHQRMCSNWRRGSGDCDE